MDEDADARNECFVRRQFMVDVFRVQTTNKCHLHLEICFIEKKNRLDNAFFDNEQWRWSWMD